MKCFTRPLVRPPEGGCGQRCAEAHPTGVGAGPDLRVIPAEAGNHVGALEMGPRFRGDDRECGVVVVGWNPTLRGVRCGDQMIF